MKLASMLTILDRPEHPQTALKRALQLQQATGADAQWVSFCWNAVYEDRHLFDAKQRRELRHETVEKVKQWQRQQLKSVDKPKLKTIWRRDIAPWVHDQMVSDPVDLVIKSARTPGVQGHSVTNLALLRTCPSPVMLVRPGKQKGTGNVLAAIDLRSQDVKHRRLNIKVLDAAHRFAELYGGKVHCVFAIEVSQVLRDLDLINPAKQKKKIVAQCQPELNALLAGYHLPKNRIHQPVGKAGHVVNQAAKDIKADLLVVGSYAHRTKQIMGLGSTAERLLTRAPCDVLAVHP